MYRHGYKARQYRSRRPVWIGFGCLVLVVFGGLFLASKYLKPDTKVSQAAPVVRKVTAGASAVKGFDEPSFELELPTDWKLVSHTDQPYNLYYFQGTTVASRSRILQVYQDTIPINFMVNRVQPIEANAEHISAVGTVSDNCAEFTKGPSVPGKPGTLAKWVNVDFLCDLDNYERNVIGTSAKGSLNSVSLKGPSGAEHKFFFAYSDQSINPNYDTFYTALKSFSVK